MTSMFQSTDLTQPCQLTGRTPPTNGFRKPITSLKRLRKCAVYAQQRRLPPEVIRDAFASTERGSKLPDDILETIAHQALSGTPTAVVIEQAFHIGVRQHIRRARHQQKYGITNGWRDLNFLGFIVDDAVTGEIHWYRPVQEEPAVPDCFAATDCEHRLDIFATCSSCHVSTCSLCWQRLAHQRCVCRVPYGAAPGGLYRCFHPSQGIVSVWARGE